MTDILHIARSGVLASRAALAVTAENVANAGTDGYRRRDVATVAAAGAQATAFSHPTGGQGVSVVEVRRAFDNLVAERGRNATSAQSAALAHQGVAESLELQFVPGENGLDGTMRNFFDALARLAASPADMTTRATALDQAGALATHVAETAASVTRLRLEAEGRATLVATESQGILADLHHLNAQMAQMGQFQPAGNHPLADRRDALLTELARNLPIAATLQADGRAEVRLGSDAGPMLLDSKGPSQLSISAPDRLTLHITTPDGVARETRLLTSGAMGGLSMGLGAIDMAQQELDQLARTLVVGLNQIHRTGVDLSGAPGQDLFQMQGWTAAPAPANGGRVQVQTTLTAAQTLSGPVSLIYDASLSEWQARDADNQVLGSGRERLVLSGVTVDLAGTARDGDRVTLNPVAGRALDMRLVLSDARALAASADMIAGPVAGNAGVAKVQVSRQPDIPRPDALDIMVTDAAAGLIELRDPLDDSVLATGAFGPDGRVSVLGLDLQLTGAAMTGDRFTLRPTPTGSGNGDVAQALAGLRRLDSSSAGFGALDQLGQFQGTLGTRAAATQRASATAEARLESAQREEAAFGAVNLDVEAARMVELQQSYQASAQALSVARSLFDTLLRMM
jgi:flagellar hook-associated protein 1